ncbi:uncharacterized protein VTP21DRAFT_11684 [Calcarisporiella thermophila]|uniref:uncharacterized protein n=1 Tax=Calcarisporiella thermophila TaxID=911321 RepID=UPI003743FB4B
MKYTTLATLSALICFITLTQTAPIVRNDVVLQERELGLEKLPIISKLVEDDEKIVRGTGEATEAGVANEEKMVKEVEGEEEDNNAFEKRGWMREDIQRDKLRLNEKDMQAKEQYRRQPIYKRQTEASAHLTFKPPMQARLLMPESMIDNPMQAVGEMPLNEALGMISMPNMRKRQLPIIGSLLGGSGETPAAPQPQPQAPAQAPSMEAQSTPHEKSRKSSQTINHRRQLDKLPTDNLPLTGSSSDDEDDVDTIDDQRGDKVGVKNKKPAGPLGMVKGLLPI